MANLSVFTKNNLNKQGFGILDDEAKSRYALALRFSPGVGTILIGIGLVLQSPPWLGSMALVALSGALFPKGMLLDLVWVFVISSMPIRCHPRQRHADFPTYFLLSYWRVQPFPSISGWRVWGSSWGEWLS
jgi:hypothetical protein